MIKEFGYKTGEQTRTFDTYNDVDCFNYSDVHDYIKYIKHGYGKVTDHACREIRLRRMTREQGVQLIKQNNNRPMKNLSLFLNWLGITENSFHYIIDQHRNPVIWQRNDNWEWELKTDLLKQMQDQGDQKSSLEQVEQFSPFLLTGKGESTDHKRRYILIGKGYKY